MDAYAGIAGVSNDILTEILVRLPLKSIFKCRCLSKRWYNFIMEPDFIKSYCQQRRKESCVGLLGFILAKHNTRSPSWNTNPDSKFNLLPVNYTRGFPIDGFISSSNGLFLCGNRHSSIYRVGNPITKRWVSLPPPPQKPPPQKPNSFVVLAGLVCCEPSFNDLEVRFKVVRVTTTRYGNSNSLLIDTYSSFTSEWRESSVVAPYHFAFDAYKETPTVIGEVLHWFAHNDILVVYDSNERNGGGDNHLLQLIELPLGDYKTCQAIGKTEEDGRLWYGGSNNKNLNIWVLPKRLNNNVAKEEWELVHIVSMDTLRNDFPKTKEEIWKEKRLPITKEEIWKDKCAIPKQFYCLPITKEEIWKDKCAISDRFHRRRLTSLYDALNLFWLEAFVPWDPLIVLLRIRNGIVLYHLESKRMELVQFHGRHWFQNSNWKWHPYFDSLSVSSYTFGV